jgi:hypothetical protein
MTWFSNAWRITTISMRNVLHILRTTSSANIFGCVFLYSYPGSNMYNSHPGLLGYDLIDPFHMKVSPLLVTGWTVLTQFSSLVSIAGRN